MLNKKGLTLIEVIVSIAILGILAVSFLPLFTNHYKWIIETKTKITQDAFKAQKGIEENINKIKTAMLEGNIESDKYNDLGISKKISSIKLFNDEFSSYSERYFPNAYETMVTLGGRERLVAIVGDKRLPELPVPTIDIVSLKFMKNDIESGTKVEYFDYENIRLQAISNMSKNPQNSFNRYRHEWFVSKPGFNIPVPAVGNIDEDFDLGAIYPRFPEDYEAIPISSELNNSYTFKNSNERIITGVLRNNVVKKYPGRHILYTITPYAKSLKKGSTSVRLPLFLSGPNTTRNLKYHLDASTILKGDIYNNKTNPYGSIVFEDNVYYLKNWKNNRPSIESANTIYNAVQNDISRMPVFKNDILLYKDLEVPLDMEINFQKDTNEKYTDKKVIGRALGNNSNYPNVISSMKTSNLNLGNNWTIFTIMRKVGEPSLINTEIPIISGFGNKPWDLKWTIDGRLSFRGQRIEVEDEDNSGELKYTWKSVELSETLNLDNWHLVEISKNDSNTKISAVNLKSNTDKSFEPRNTGKIDTKSEGIDINWNGVEVSEILVYDSKMSEEELIEIKNYLVKKYNH